MISELEAVAILKEYWGVEEFTFLGRFEVSKRFKRGNDPKAFGFFGHIYLNKQRLELPFDGAETEIKYAACYAKKGDLKHNGYYMITAKLNSEEHRKNDPFRMELVEAKKASTQEIAQHKVDGEDLALGYVNFVADDKSHAFVKQIGNTLDKTIGGGVLSKIKELRGKKGQGLSNFSTSLKEGQIVVINTKENIKFPKFETNVFQGYFVNGCSFLDYDSLHNWLHIELGERELNLPVNSGEADQRLKDLEGFNTIDVTIGVGKNGLQINSIEGFENISSTYFEQKIRESVAQILSTKLLTRSNVMLYEVIRGVDANLEEMVEDYFLIDLNNLAKDVSEKALRKFIKKWSILAPDKILLSEIKHTEFNSFYIGMWGNEELPETFFESALLDCFITFAISEAKEIDELFNDFTPRRIAVLNKALFELVDQNFIIESIDIYNVIWALINKLDEEHFIYKKLHKKIRVAASEGVKFELWCNEKITEVPIELALKNVSKLNSHLKQLLIEQITDTQLWAHLNAFEESNNNFIENRISNLKQTQLVKILKPVTFDIESDGENISEIAWVNGVNCEYFTGITVPEGILEFNKISSSASQLIVGHNVIKFDLPILAKTGKVTYHPANVWDTFNIEKILSPELSTFALNTMHTAKDDAEHTKNLFVNQLFRIVCAGQDKVENLKGALPEWVYSELLAISSKTVNKEKLQTLNENKLDFYRPQPKENTIISELDTLLKEAKVSNTFILGTESIISDLTRYGKVVFQKELLQNQELQVLDEVKVENSEQLGEAIKQQLAAFLLMCKESGSIPYWANVSASIRIEIEELTDVWSLFTPTYFDSTPYEFAQFFTPIQLEEYLLENTPVTDIELIVLQKDLISISQKDLLKTFDIAQLNAVIKDNFFWMRFSGGQSIVALTAEEVSALNVENLAAFDNFWIEKYKYGKYRVFGSKNWEKMLESDVFKKVSHIHLDPIDFKTDQVKSTRFVSDHLSDFNITRFNPESIYRTRYWVIQKKLVDQIAINDASVLVIQRREEISKLEKHFTNSGYYIPNAEIGLGRRLELLHRHRENRKIIIAHLDDIDKILKLNHTNAIQLIVDSFNLKDLFYCAKGSSFFTSKMQEGVVNMPESINESETDSKDTKTVNETAFVQDPLFLLKLLRPWVTNIRNLMQLNNESNILWLLDPRVDDHKEILKEWNIKRQFFSGWDNEDDYEYEVKELEKYITTPRAEELPFSLEEAKKIMSKVFLEGKPWYDYQDKYLDGIIEGKKDWLISLPTGGGKSLLFQAPAILKSAFTNRLTIVVTPLKALMEDQVLGLWSKGFYSNVEYLNSDRGMDAEVIYRGMSGGELSLLFVTPERFRSKSFLSALEGRVSHDGGLEYFVFDEAHCVSQWGHDFRPDYFNCAKQVWRTKVTSEHSAPLLLFSATVSEKIYNDFNTIFS